MTVLFLVMTFALFLAVDCIAKKFQIKKVSQTIKLVGRMSPVKVNF